MKYSFLLAILCAAVSSRGQQVIHDSNAEQRQVGSFDAIEISSAFDLRISQGNEDAVAVSAASAEDRANIRTEVRNGVLHIGYEPKKWYKGGGNKLRAYVSVKNLKHLKSSGACDIAITGELKADELAIDLSGASDFKGHLNVRAFKVDLSGASDMTVGGRVDNANIDASGASHFKGYDLAAENCIIQSSGASDVKVTVNKVLNAQASGASSIDYKGAGMIRDIKTSGASSVSRKG